MDDHNDKNAPKNTTVCFGNMYHMDELEMMLPENHGFLCHWYFWNNETILVTYDGNRFSKKADA